MRERLHRITESAPFRRTVIALICLNAVIIGAETYPFVTENAGPTLHAADRAILWLFVVELLLRFGAAPSPRFFANGWNAFDVAVVASGFIPGSAFLSVVRIFRVLRVLRAITVLPNLQKLVSALFRSLPSMGHILLLLGILIYVYGASGTFLFGDIAPEYFGALHRSILTLFAVITLEGWVDVMNAVAVKANYAWVYFITFILLGTFVTLNLFVGVIVGNLQAAGEEGAKEDESLADIRRALARIEARLAEGREISKA